MNEHYLRITDKASIPEPLEIGHEYTFAGIITIEGASKDSNDDGGFKYTHKAKFTSHIELQKGDKIIRAKDKKRNSQKVKGRIWSLQQDEGMTHVDEEMFYDQMSAIIIEHLPELFIKYYEK